MRNLGLKTLKNLGKSDNFLKNFTKSPLERIKGIIRKTREFLAVILDFRPPLPAFRGHRTNALR
jgi:hypothetical protein